MESTKTSSSKISSKINGLLLVDKPMGMTSHDVVGKVRRILGTPEVGHSGTLDPIASGLMVLLIGEATKLSQYVTDGDKSYKVQLQLGIETDTLDSTGAVLKENFVSCDGNQVKNEADRLTGSLTLPIPMFSAKKVDGKKLYEYARSQIEISQPTKTMKFWNVQAISEDDTFKNVQNQFIFSLHCSKGSFIRSWVSELGTKLGCGAMMTGLRRTSSSEFDIKNAVTLEKLAELVNKTDQLQGCLIPITEALGAMKRLKVRDFDLTLLKNGQISQGLRASLIRVFDPNRDEFVQVLSDRPEKLVALIGLSPEKGFVIRRVFN